MNVKALAALTREWYEKAGIKDEEPGGMLLRIAGERSHESRDLAFAGSIRESARAILAHPLLSRRDKRVWRARLRGDDYREIAQSQNLSFSTVAATIRRIKALMLRPEWDKYMSDEKPRRKKAEPKEDERMRFPLEIPGLPPPTPFADIEASIEMGTRVAHAKIVELHRKVEEGFDTLTSLDVADNERAVHTLLAVRRSELEYVKNGMVKPPGDPDAVRKAATGGEEET